MTSKADWSLNNPENCDSLVVLGMLYAPKLSRNQSGHVDNFVVLAMEGLVVFLKRLLRTRDTIIIGGVNMIILLIYALMVTL
jgi:hypothetical protein